MRATWPRRSRPRTRPSRATKVPLPAMAERGVEVRKASRTRGLTPLKLGRPLLEERPRSLPIVLALERLKRQLLQLGAALFGQPEEVRLDRQLGAPHGQGRVVGDFPQI